MIDIMEMRPEFQAIVSGWTLIDGTEDLEYRIETAAAWTEKNGPLLPREEVTMKLMIRTRIARGIMQGDFDGTGMSREQLLEALK